MAPSTTLLPWTVMLITAVVPLSVRASEVSSESSAAKPLTELVQQTAPAVVTLRTFDVRGKQVGLGSGFLVEGGRVVTNAHVVHGAMRVEIYDHQDNLLGTTDHAQSLSSRVDLAVLPPMPDPPGALQLAPEEPAVGESVIVFGAPQGLTNTVSTGIVSAWREQQGGRLMQISAPISQGSSGGPVVNGQGLVLAVSVAVLREGQNLNFAVPARYVRAVLGSPPGRIPFTAETAPAAAVGPAPSAAEPSPGMRAPPEARAGHGSSSSGAPGKPGDLASFFSRQPRLEPGSPAEGQLDDQDHTLTAGEYMDLYSFEGRAGETLTVIAVSDEFDVMVGAAGIGSDGETDALGWDDDGGGGTDARLVVRLRRSGVHGVMVTSADPGEVGQYRVAVVRADLPKQNAMEDRWITLDESSERTIRYDGESLVRGGNGWVRVWQVIDFARPQTEEGLQFDSLKMQMEVDCRARRIRALSVVQYSGAQTAASNTFSRAVWSDWVPESVGESLGRAVCARPRR